MRTFWIAAVAGLALGFSATNGAAKTVQPVAAPAVAGSATVAGTLATVMPRKAAPQKVKPRLVACGIYIREGQGGAIIQIDYPWYFFFAGQTECWE